MSERRVHPDSPPIEVAESMTRAIVPVGSDAIRRGRTRQELARGSSGTLKWGVYSRVAIRPEVLDECAALYGRMPHLDQIRDGVLVESTARLIVRLRKLDEAIDHEPTQVLTSLYARLEGQLTRNLQQLGMTPAAATSLGLARLSAVEHARVAAERAMAAYAPRRAKKVSR